VPIFLSEIALSEIAGREPCRHPQAISLPAAQNRLCGPVPIKGSGNYSKVRAPHEMGKNLFLSQESQCRGSLSQVELRIESNWKRE